MKIGNREFDVNNRTYIMGILNVTPDSFSDGGKWNTMDHALKHAEAMIADGADILDVGGESTRPGHTPVSAEEEAARVVPVIEALRKHFDVPISVDTYKGSVADVAVQGRRRPCKRCLGTQIRPGNGRCHRKARRCLLPDAQ